MKSKNDLIYDLIFSTESLFIIDLSDYVEDIYLYDDFVDEIKIILKKSKVTVAKSTIKIDSKTAIWELKVKK